MIRMTNQNRSEGAGYDHAMFDFRSASDPAPFTLPKGKDIIVTLTIVLQRFHIDAKPPYAVPGMLSRPWPDIGNATQREVGLHDGLWRVLDALEEMRAAASFVVEADALSCLEDVRERLSAEQHAIVAGGRHAMLLHGPQMPVEEEARLIAGVKTEVEAFAGRAITGWRSPYNAQSANSLALLADAGFIYCCDFNNDERPYRLKSTSGDFWSVAMPHTTSDLHNIDVSRQTAQAFFHSQLRGIDWLLASQQLRPIVYPLVLHPWIIGVPHRIETFREFLQALNARPRLDLWSSDRLVNTCI